MSKAPVQVLAIDLVRFTCAMMVVAHHYAAMLPIAPPEFARGAAVDAGWALWTWWGWIGVELFFVVSGYVIAVSAAGGTGRAFVVRRALRLAPAAWICATLTTLVALAAAIDSPAALVIRWAASVAFWPLTPQADPSYWTLGIEVSFYALIAATLRGRAERLDAVAALLALAGLAYWAGRGGWSAPESGDRLTDLMLLPHGAFFAIGIALWRMRAAGVSPARLAILAAGLAAGTMEIVAQAGFMTAGLRLEAGPAVPLMVFAAGVAAIAGAARLQGPLARHVGARALGLAGLITYPLYLIHQQSGFVLILVLRRWGVPSSLAIVLAGVVALAVAAAITLWLEPPLRRWLVPGPAGRAPAPDTPPTASLPAG